MFKDKRGSRRQTLQPAVLAGALAMSLATLADDGKGTLTLALENDLFASGGDEHYTHGTEIAYVSDTYMPGWFERAAALLPFHDKDDETRFSWSLGQQMYTPDNLQAETVIADDRPYAGWLYTSLGLVSESRESGDRHVDTVELVVGLVGPDSGAENTQKAIHKVLDSDTPKGWDNQLDDEVTVDLRYQREWTITLVDDHLDMLPATGFTLGSSQRRAQAGLTLRIGDGLDADYGPPLIRPRTVGSHYFRSPQPFYWYVFAGARGQYVDYNIFLNGNRDGDSHSVEPREWVGSVQAGAVMGWDGWRISITNIFQSREFEKQDDPDEFGSIAVSYRF
jgi:hypothetical protein